MKYIRDFETVAAFQAAQATLDLPNVSLIEENMGVYYKSYVEPVETRLICKYVSYYEDEVIQLLNSDEVLELFSAVEIDGVEQSEVTTSHTFSTIGEHTVKYTLADTTSIGDYAFNRCSGLTSIDISDGVTSIGNSAFYGCSGLTSISIPNSVTSIGTGAFNGCSSLTSCTIGSGVTSIGQNVFYRCSGLTSCTIGSGVTTIGTSAFYGCSGLTSIVIPNSVTSIGSSAFRNCSGLTSIVSNATPAPTIQSSTFRDVKSGGTLRVPQGSSGYDVWMGTGNYYLGNYGWTKVEQ